MLVRAPPASEMYTDIHCFKFRHIIFFHCAINIMQVVSYILDVL